MPAARRARPGRCRAGVVGERPPRGLVALPSASWRVSTCCPERSTPTCWRARRTRRTRPATELPRSSSASRALDELRARGDDIATGRVHRWLSRVHWYQGRRLQAEVQAQLAVKVLEPLPPSIELAWAYSNLSQLEMLSWRYAGVDQVGGALDRAGAASSTPTTCSSTPLVNVGSVRMMEDPDDDGPIRDGHRPSPGEGRPPRGDAGDDLPRLRHDGYRPARTRPRQLTRDALQYADQHEVEALRQYLRRRCSGGSPPCRAGGTRRAHAAGGRRCRRGRPADRRPHVAGARSRCVAATRRRRRRSIGRGRSSRPPGKPQRIVPLAVVEAERAWLRGRARPVRPPPPRRHTTSLAGVAAGKPP